MRGSSAQNGMADGRTNALDLAGESQRMSVQTPTDENVPDREQTETLALERPNYLYGYLGEDADGRHHHVDYAADRVIVTEDSFERTLPEGAAVYRIAVRGEVLESTPVADHPDADGLLQGLRIWIDYVEGGVGWESRPKDVTAVLRDRLEGFDGSSEVSDR